MTAEPDRSSRARNSQIDVFFEVPYGWFVRVERGIYTLSDSGKVALVRWGEQVPAPAANPHRPEAAVPERSSA